MTNPGNDGIPQHGEPSPPWAARARKFLVGGVGLAAQVASCVTLPDNIAVWVNTALAIATAAGIYQVPNAKKPEPTQ